MNSESIINSVRSLSLRKTFLLIAAVFALIIIVNILLKGDDFKVVSLALPDSNKSVEVIGDELYAFNGANFYKQAINVEGSKPVVLGGGIKLPVVTHAIWAADKGVLLNFDQSTIGTEVSEVATNLNLSFTEERESTWYYDFIESKLYHVGPYQIIGQEQYFSAKNNAIKFTENKDGLTFTHSFDIKTKKDTAVLLASDFSVISSISDCFDDTSSTCVTGRKSDSDGKSGVYKVNADGSLVTKYETQGEVLSLPGSGWVLTLASKDDSSEVTDGSISQYKKATVTNLETKKLITVNKTFGPGNFLFTIYENDNVAMIGNGGLDYIRTGTLSGIPYTSSDSLRYSNGEKFEASPVVDYQPQVGKIVFPSTDGLMNIFVKKDTPVVNFVRKSEQKVSQSLRSCVGDIDVEWQSENQTFTMFVPDDSGFKDKVRRISECIADQQIMHGYLYAFTSVDPRSGRPTSY